MNIDPRIDGSVNTAPIWAKALLAMTAALLGSDKTKDAIDTLDGISEPDYSVRMHGRPLVSWLGISRETMERIGLIDDQIDDIAAALKERGRDVAYLDKPKSAKATKPADPEGGAGSGAGGGSTGDAGTGDTTPPEPKKVAGHLVKELAGKPYDELLTLEGIGPAKAKMLSKLAPGTEA